MKPARGRSSPPNRRDDELHGRRAASDAEIEEHDIADMLDAIAAYRRRARRRSIGEDLADDLSRGTWHEAD